MHKRVIFLISRKSCKKRHFGITLSFTILAIFLWIFRHKSSKKLVELWHRVRAFSSFSKSSICRARASPSFFPYLVRASFFEYRAKLGPITTKQNTLTPWTWLYLFDFPNFRNLKTEKWKKFLQKQKYELQIEIELHQILFARCSNVDRRPH